MIHSITHHTSLSQKYLHYPKEYLTIVYWITLDLLSEVLSEVISQTCCIQLHCCKLFNIFVHNISSLFKVDFHYPRSLLANPVFELFISDMNVIELSIDRKIDTASSATCLHHTYTLIVTLHYTCCYDEIKGTQDFKICPSHADSLRDSLLAT